jgi:hypothetical protein
LDTSGCAIEVVDLLKGLANDVMETPTETLYEVLELTAPESPLVELQQALSPKRLDWRQRAATADSGPTQDLYRLLLNRGKHKRVRRKRGPTRLESLPLPGVAGLEVEQSPAPRATGPEDLTQQARRVKMIELKLQTELRREARLLQEASAGVREQAKVRVANPPQPASDIMEGHLQHRRDLTWLFLVAG